MNPRELELALARQRLQFEAARQREALARGLAELAPLFAAADYLAAGIASVRRHPEFAVGGLALLIAASRKARAFLWRWSKRGFFLWQLWRRHRVSFRFPSGSR